MGWNAEANLTRDTPTEQYVAVDINVGWGSVKRLIQMLTSNDDASVPDE